MPTYSTEFKAKAVEKIVDNDTNLITTTYEFGAAIRTLFNWQNKTNKGKLVGTDPYYTEIMATLEKIKQLK